LIRFTFPCPAAPLLIGVLLLTGCSGSMAHYVGIERSLSAGQPDHAAQVLQSAQQAYGSKDRLLYLLEEGMVLHLAGRYADSNRVLEEAHHMVEDLYTTHIRDEAAALLVNEARKPYEGAPHEHVLMNVIKAFNFLLLGQWQEALVEARRIDHRLNVLTDRVGGGKAYHEDPFARYVVGLLYDIAGDFNNAYVGYRKAETVYQAVSDWSNVSLPDMLKRDLIQTARRLGLHDEVERYRERYAEVDSHMPADADPKRAQVLVVGYHGHGPKKEDMFVDVPISLDALTLVGLTKVGIGRSTRATRGGEALLYGIHGRIARIALPQFSPQPSPGLTNTITLVNDAVTVINRSERVYDVQAVAEKTLGDDYNTLVLRAAARSAMKMAAAEGMGVGARAFAGGDNRDIIGLFVTIIARVLALATEEADIRTWRTLPREIHLARFWVEPGEYSVNIKAYDRLGRGVGRTHQEQIQLEAGKAHVLIHQVFP
jgi:uncharacterized protein